MIPKIIHYCWLSDDPIPEQFQRYMDGWKEKLADYEFKKWSLDNFDINSSIWAKEAFEKKRYATAADVVRLYALYTMGGIYLDMDIEVKKTFNDLLDKSLMLAYENLKEDSIEAGVIGAEKGNFYIKKCLDFYNGKHFINSDGTLPTITLPEIMYNALKDANYKGEIYPCSYFTAKSYETGDIYADGRTYCIHHFAGGWKTERQKAWHRFQKKLRKKYGMKLGERILRFPPIRLYGAIYMYGFRWTTKRLISKVKGGTSE